MKMYTAHGRLGLCAIVSRRLTPLERNYMMKERELLAIVDAPEKGSHFLKGHLEYIVQTNHKNLSSELKESVTN